MTTETFERETQQAWNDLETALIAYFQSEPEEHTLLIELPEPLEDVEGASPYIQLTVEDDGDVRAEAPSNHYLDVRYALTDERMADIEAVGWDAPTYAPEDEDEAGSANYWADILLPDEADRLAAMLVLTLRYVYGALHPSFLTVSGFGPEGRLGPADLPLGLTVVTPEAPARVAPVVAEPSDADGLRDLVEAALRTVVDDELEYDADGDIPIEAEDTTIYVRVEEDSPSIRIFAPLVFGVRWTPRVGSQLAALNHRWRYAKVVFSDGAVFATTQLHAMPFVSSHLTDSLKGMQLLVDELVPELREELTGDVFSPGGRGASSDWEDE